MAVLGFIQVGDCWDCGSLTGIRFWFFFFFFFKERERESMSRGEAEREGDTEFEAGSRL